MGKMSEKKQQFRELYLAGKPLDQVRAIVGINWRTAQAWASEPSFALAVANSDPTLADIRRTVIRVGEASMRILNEIQHNDNAPDYVRVDAAKILYQGMVRMAEQDADGVIEILRERVENFIESAQGVRRVN